jgi:hypothetical protein
MMRFSITVKIEFKFTNLPSFAFLYRYLFGDLVIVPGRDTLGLSPLRFLHSHDALQGLGQCGNGQGTDVSCLARYHSSEPDRGREYSAI